MVDMFRMTTTKGASLISPLKGFAPCGFPSNTSALWFAASISWVTVTALIFGLPFSHANIRTKRFNRMKTRGRAFNIFAAPHTRLYLTVARSLCATLITGISALHRTICLVSRNRLITGQAALLFAFAKPMRDVALAGAVWAMIVLLDPWKRLITILTVHTSIIPQNMWPINCDIARARIEAASKCVQLPLLEEA